MKCLDDSVDDWIDNYHEDISNNQISYHPLQPWIKKRKNNIHSEFQLNNNKKNKHEKSITLQFLSTIRTKKQLASKQHSILQPIQVKQQQQCLKCSPVNNKTQPLEYKKPKRKRQAFSKQTFIDQNQVTTLSTTLYCCLEDDQSLLTLNKKCLQNKDKFEMRNNLQKILKMKEKLRKKNNSQVKKIKLFSGDKLMFIDQNHVKNITLQQDRRNVRHKQEKISQPKSHRQKQSRTLFQNINKLNPQRSMRHNIYDNKGSFAFMNRTLYV